MEKSQARDPRQHELPDKRSSLHIAVTCVPLPVKQRGGATGGPVGRAVVGSDPGETQVFEGPLAPLAPHEV